MTRNILSLGTAAALTAALTLPAFANDANLAASVGVEPGVYTTAELIQLAVALEGDDVITANHILGAGGETVSSQGAAVGQGDRQLAASLGVEPGVYSTAELIQLTVAMEENDMPTINRILSGGSETVSTQSSGASQGNQQLAAFLDVNANDYTTAELAEMYIDRVD